MPEVFMPELDRPERVRLLRDTADKVEITTYQKPLEIELIERKRALLTDNLIKLNVLEEKFDEIKQDFKGKMKPLKLENQALLQEVKTGQETVEGEIFEMADYESGMMKTYDGDGALLSSRRLLPNEKKQGRLFVATKTGTND